MSEQPYLLFESSSRIAFEEHHKEHPEVYALFKRFTFEVIRANRNRFGARMIAERIRWHSLVESEGAFKYNDHFTPFYVRLFEAEFPEHAGLFEKRRAIADG